MDRAGFQMFSATSTVICAELAGVSIRPRYRALCMSKVLLFITVISSKAASWCTKSDHARRIVGGSGWI